MTEKLVSVIMPACNAERTIGKALESVRAQTYQNWEIIVVNDGGTDATGRMVAEFAQHTPRNVMLLEHAQSRGPSAARNIAMKAAKGEYLAFLDADDIWMPEHLGRLCAVLDSGKADLAYAGGYVFRETPSGEIELLPIDTIEVKNPRQDLFRRNYFNTSAAAITRQLMEAAGDFDESIWAGEEWDYWIRAAALGFAIASTEEQTYYYRKSAGSLSAVPAKMAESSGRMFEKHRQCGILSEGEIVARARASYFAAGRMYWREDPAAASRMFHKSWSLSKVHMLPFVCWFLAAGLSLARPHRSQ
ncbi:MAG: glycosyltransferase family 2 protein [Terracidiphilus sp.]|jgi:glycosyltransferase involved in cell wall biosynthesis